MKEGRLIVEQVNAIAQLLVTIAVIIASAYHTWEKEKKKQLTVIQLITSVADEVVQRIEQMRKNRARDGGSPFTQGQLQSIAVEKMQRQFPEVDTAELIGAIEAAVSRLPKSNLQQPRDGSGRFAKRE
jgi:hypothetical protein